MSGQRLAHGQVRVICVPKFFMDPSCVQMRTVSADPKFHRNRVKYQEELAQLLLTAFGHGKMSPTLALPKRALPKRASPKKAARRLSERRCTGPRQRVRARRQPPCLDEAYWRGNAPNPSSTSIIEHLREADVKSKGLMAGAAGVRHSRFPFQATEEVSIGTRRFRFSWHRARQVRPEAQRRHSHRTSWAYQPSRVARDRERAVARWSKFCNFEA